MKNEMRRIVDLHICEKRDSALDGAIDNVEKTHGIAKEWKVEAGVADRDRAR